MKVVQERDEQKQAICKATGITLIVIPYWWDRTIEEVANAIHSVRPDIFVPASLLRGKSIPREIPQPQKNGKTKEKI